MKNINIILKKVLWIFYIGVFGMYILLFIVQISVLRVCMAEYYINAPKEYNKK